MCFDMLRVVGFQREDLLYESGLTEFIESYLCLEE